MIQKVPGLESFWTVTTSRRVNLCGRVWSASMRWGSWEARVLGDLRKCWVSPTNYTLKVSSSRSSTFQKMSKTSQDVRLVQKRSLKKSWAVVSTGRLIFCSCGFSNEFLIKWCNFFLLSLIGVLCHQISVTLWSIKNIWSWSVWRLYICGRWNDDPPKMSTSILIPRI